jgi:hypothetical protein
MVLVEEVGEAVMVLKVAKEAVAVHRVVADKADPCWNLFETVALGRMGRMVMAAEQVVAVGHRTVWMMQVLLVALVASEVRGLLSCFSTS